MRAASTHGRPVAPAPRRVWGRLRARLRAFDGAVLTETAIVVSVLLVPLVFGIIEFGVLFKDKLTMETGARAGARVGAAAANAPNADEMIVQAVLSATSSLPSGALR